MKSLKVLAVVAAATFGLAACGEYAEVPLGHYGKIKTKEGMKPGVIGPSQFRLPACWLYCDKLMIVEATDFPITEAFRGEHSLYMPRSELAMPFDVRATFAIENREGVLDGIFERLPSDEWGRITAQQIYDTYGRPVVRDVVRRVLSNYSIEEVSSNRARINAELNDELRKQLQNTPLAIRSFGLGDVRFPDVILTQKETAARRKIAIQQEEAEKQIRLVKLQADLEAAKAERAIRREKAEASKEENQIYADSVSDKYLAYRRLEVLEKLAENKNATFLPFGALDEVGVSNKVFNTNPSSTTKE